MAEGLLKMIKLRWYPSSILKKVLWITARGNVWLKWDYGLESVSGPILSLSGDKERAAATGFICRVALDAVCDCPQCTALSRSDKHVYDKENIWVTLTVEFMCHYESYLTGAGLGSSSLSHKIEKEDCLFSQSYTCINSSLLKCFLDTITAFYIHRLMNVI